MKHTDVSYGYRHLIYHTLLLVVSIKQCISQSADGTTVVPTTSPEITGSGIETTFTPINTDETTFFTTNNGVTTITSLFDGSADSITTASEGSAFFTTSPITGSGDVTTVENSADITTIEGSGNIGITTSSGGEVFDTTAEIGSTAIPTTVFVVTTAVFDDFTTGNGTMNATTGFVPVARGGLEWYFIVIICMGILILLLIIFFIIFCCLYKKDDDTKKAVSPEEIKTVDNNKLDITASYVPQAKTILPEPKQDQKPVSNLISETPMVPPVYFENASTLVRKREKARSRIEPAISGSDEYDEGFQEPLLVKTVQKQPRIPRKRSPIRKLPQVDEEEFLTERAPTNYQPYYLPTPVQTALTSKALANTLTNNEMDYRHNLQRSEIERHRNKQRLRRRNTPRINDQFRDEQRNIDSVLAPPPPAVLQPSARQRLRQKHGNAMRIEGKGAKKQLKDTRLLVDGKQGKYKNLNMSDTEDSETSSQKKIRSHEATISRMAKLLDDAFALLSPLIQKNMVGNAPTTSQPPNPWPPVPPPSGYMPQQAHSYYTQAPPNEMLFTRVSTPPALLPQNDQAYADTRFNNRTLPTSKDRSNDADSIIWTPYRTFDKLEELKHKDSSFSPLNSTRSSDPNNITSRTNNTNLGPQNGNFDDTYMKEGTETTGTIVQSIKDALSKMTGTSTAVKEISDLEAQK